MTYCFKCRAELPTMAMIYCVDCSLWVDDDDAEATVIRDIAPASATFVGRVRSSPRQNGRVRYLAVTATGLIILSGLCLYMREGSSLQRAEYAEGARSTIENIQGASARGAKAKLVTTTLSLPPLPKVRKLQEPNMKVAIKRQPMRTRVATKPQSMRTRVEIVDGVERCYALPGGREIPC